MEELQGHTVRRVEGGLKRAQQGSAQIVEFVWTELEERFGRAIDRQDMNVGCIEFYPIIPARGWIEEEGLGWILGGSEGMNLIPCSAFLKNRAP